MGLVAPGVAGAIGTAVRDRRSASRRASMATSFGIDRAHLVDGIEGGVDRRERQTSMEQEHLDQSPRAGSVAVASSGHGPEEFVGRGERARLTGLREGIEPGNAPGLRTRISR